MQSLCPWIKAYHAHNTPLTKSGRCEETNRSDKSRKQRADRVSCHIDFARTSHQRCHGAQVDLTLTGYVWLCNDILLRNRIMYSTGIHNLKLRRSIPSTRHRPTCSLTAGEEELKHHSWSQYTKIVHSTLSQTVTKQKKKALLQPA